MISPLAVARLPFDVHSPRAAFRFYEECHAGVLRPFPPKQNALPPSMVMI
jgi:hypothetical protein